VCSAGQYYGLEKFWAFMKYYKYSKNLVVDPKLQQILSKFKTVDDFRILEVILLFRALPWHVSDLMQTKSNDRNLHL